MKNNFKARMNIKNNNIEALDNFVFFLTLFRMGLFEIAHGWEGGGGQQKLSTVIPCIKKIQKIYKLLDILLKFC